MGISSDGLHFFGLCWNSDDTEDLGLPWLTEDDEEAEDAACRILGGPSRPGWAPGAWESGGALTIYNRERDAFLLDRLGGKIAFGIHCSYEYAMPYVAIAESCTTAARGRAEPAKSGDEGEWRATIERFAVLMGIEITDEIGPRWWVASLYG